MNWIIKQSKKLKFHTDLRSLIIPIWDDVKSFNWLISDLEFMSSDPVPLNYDHDYFILSPEEFNVLAHADVQIIWGVISGVPATQLMEIDENNMPYADGNELVWKDGNIQQKQAVIEVVCFDSGYTIIKFKSIDLSMKFKNYFDEAIELEMFK
jgi:hypothetical protein